MKGAFLKLWLLLTSALLLFVFLSTFDSLTVFGHQIAVMKMPEKEGCNEPPLHPSKPMASVKSRKAVAALPPDTLPKTILFIGDSMLEGLSPRFAAYAEANGHKLYSVIWYGSSTLKWAESHRLAELKERYAPDYIVVCLGGNELFIRNVITDRAKFVDTILSEIGDTPYVWIGPPNWKEDTGINSLLLSKVGGRRFFVSKDLKLDRAKDGAHPTHKAAAVWMDSIAGWVVRSSEYPIMLRRPDKQTGRAARTIVYKPDD